MRPLRKVRDSLHSQNKKKKTEQERKEKGFYLKVGSVLFVIIINFYFFWLNGGLFDA